MQKKEAIKNIEKYETFHKKKNVMPKRSGSTTKAETSINTTED